MANGCYADVFNRACLRLKTGVASDYVFFAFKYKAAVLPTPESGKLGG